MKTKPAKLLIAAALFASVSWPGSASAQDFKERLATLLQEHNLVEVARLDLQAANERVREAWGAYFPTLNLNAFVGRHGKSNNNADSTLLNPREAKITLTQKIYDFGATDANITRSKLERRSAETFQKIAVQDLLLQALTAQLNIIRATELVDYARRSEQNILKQQKVEKDRVDAGGGQVTDLLQVQSQLAGARTRLVDAEGQLQLARNFYKRVFGDFPAPAAGKEVPLVPTNALPASVDEAVEMTKSGNLRVLAARLGADVLKQTAEATKASSYYPTLNAIGEVTTGNQVDGVDGHENETIAKLELNFPFNLGWTARNTVRAAELTHEAAFRRSNQVFTEIEEQVRNAWQNFRTARSNALLLNQQAELAGEFLDLAREERKLGKRSLIDVLAGETNLLNAQADATAANRDVAINAFTVLSFVSSLSLADVEVIPYTGPAKALR
ncbi:TolC family protein [Hwanghaeella sp.]|uniref:TolC family protein n=1 Tax=Hwanghaeella sp. TaxID=2605943 RepID=UPI003CCC043F